MVVIILSLLEVTHVVVIIVFKMRSLKVKKPKESENKNYLYPDAVDGMYENVSDTNVSSANKTNNEQKYYEVK